MMSISGSSRYLRQNPYSLVPSACPWWMSHFCINSCTPTASLSLAASTFRLGCPASTILQGEHPVLQPAGHRESREDTAPQQKRIKSSLGRLQDNDQDDHKSSQQGLEQEIRSQGVGQDAALEFLGPDGPRREEAVPVGDVQPGRLEVVSPAGEGDVYWVGGVVRVELRVGGQEDADGLSCGEAAGWGWFLTCWI